MFYSRKKVEKPLVGNKKVTTFAAALREEHGLEELKRGEEIKGIIFQKHLAV